MKTKFFSRLPRKIFRRDSLLRRAIGAAVVFSFTLNVLANPTGMTVQHGSATLQLNGSTLTINTGNNTVLNWQSFNIANGETTVFNQPSAASVVWNNIHDQSPSQIFGSLRANGIVVLLNSSGFYFGPNSFVSAAGLVVSTANCLPPQNSGGSWEFNGPPPLASIVNFGTIKVGLNGSAFLIADKVENHGNIEAPGGIIGLAAGQTVTLSERPDGRGMSMDVVLPQGSVDNYGNLVADGGTIALHAKVVNQNGLIQANSVREQNGVIELVASDSLNLGADSKLFAQGDGSAGGSAGGNVTIKSGNIFGDANGSSIITAGGANGGNGGNVEVSAPNIQSLNTAMDAHAAAGSFGGVFLLDPVNIILGTSGSGTVPANGTVAYNTSGTLSLNVSTAFLNKNFSNIKLQATGNITLSAGTTWDLSGTTGQNVGQLTLQAGGNIIFGNNSLLTDANNWSVTLQAGYNFNNNSIDSGVGNIFLNGGNGLAQSGAIQLAQGSVNLSAGNSVLVGAGYVRTVGGGSILVNALAGSVNTGTKAAGYSFLSAASVSSPMYLVDPNLGGISTAAGGDVNIVAGQNVTSLLPTSSKPSGDAGAGAFGSAAGNVNITAGGDVTGHYVVANGTGTITAGGNAGTSTAQLALSLINGGWNVNADQSIVLQEVRNPNGIFNGLGFSTSPSKHYFDYSAGAFVNLIAGNSVEITGSSLPRGLAAFDKTIPIILPGILNVMAGAGGVTIDQNLILFPSPQGSLEITTTGGGGLFGNAGGSFVQLVMSDSAARQFNSASVFGYSDHASVPLHLNNPTTIALNISGDMDNILLAVPEAATVNIGGNMSNSRFIGQNLHATDITSINVTGDILNRNVFTSVDLATAPDLALLGQAYPASDFYSSLLSQLHYDPNTKQITFQGRMTSDQLTALTSLTIQLVDKDGVPEVDGLGNPITKVVSILDSTTALALYNATQDVTPADSNGYVIGGGGVFNVNARNMDLGTTAGIQSIGPLNNSALANYFTHGAGINVNLTGNLDMFSTTISSLNGGAVSVNVDGNANIGSSTFSGSDQVARGIFTVQKSDVSVIAGGNIEVAGSRIAAYDGGNLTVASLNGNIDAGSGGRGAVTVQEVYVDPVTRQILTQPAIIPGSGILATTFPQPSAGSLFPASQNTVGNILVETPNGNINASAGGIVQLPLNNINSPDAVVQVLAGYALRDSHGDLVSAANISSGTATLVSNGRDINASGSGVIGSTVKLNASGSIIGVIFARNNIDISAQQNVNVTALAQGNINASAGGTISGTLAGIGGVNASGSSIDAALLSQNVTASGDTSGATQGFAQGNAANASAQGMSADESGKKVASTESTDEDDTKKKKGIGLAQKVGRVTVVLPAAKKLSETMSLNPKL